MTEIRGDNLKEERFIVFTAPRVVQTFDTMAQYCYLRGYRQELLSWSSYTFSNILLHVSVLCVVYEHMCVCRCTYSYMCVQRGTLLSHSHHIPLRQSLVGPRAKLGACHINPPVSACVYRCECSHIQLSTRVLGSRTQVLTLVQRVLLPTKPSLQPAMMLRVTLCFWDGLHS